MLCVPESQDPNLAEVALEVLADVSYYLPDKALPLICTRFEVGQHHVGPARFFLSGLSDSGSC